MTQSGLRHKTPPTLPPFTAWFSTSQFEFSTPQEGQPSDQPDSSRQATEIEGEGWEKWLKAIAPKTFTSPFEWFHAKFLDWYWPLLQTRAKGEEVPEETPLAGLLILGRGLGKSTILESIALAEGAHMGRSFGVYISSTEQKAGEHLQSIRDLIESSEVARYYPGLAKPRLGKFGNQRGWRAEAVYTEGGFSIVAASLEKGIRGLRDSEIRPTFILLDDIDERDDSLQTKQEKFDSIRFDALPMLAPFGLAVFAQNLIYAGSIAEDTANRKLDWFHHRFQVGPVNTFQDDLAIEKVDGRPRIVAGTPNWARIGPREGQALLDLIGEEAIYRECQNRTAPPAEQLVWTGFNESLHVITWAEFASVFGVSVIPSDFDLYGGYDAGTTGPARHPAVFVVAGVAPESSPLPDSLFIFYEFVAEAGQDEHDMARALIEDLGGLCGHYGIRQAVTALNGSYDSRMTEQQAWQMRMRAGRMVPFKSFRGSHEAASERRTFNNKWGLSLVAGDAAKTGGLSQLRFYLKPERKPHPFKAGIFGKPTIYLVVANDQARAGVDRFGLARLRWEAANLRWDVNITTRDVPTKFGDDGTDCVKHICGNFRVGQPMTEAQRIDSQLPEGWRLENKPNVPEGSWEIDGWIMAREQAIAKIKNAEKKRNPDLDDPWNGASPLRNVPESPWANWERE